MTQVSMLAPGTDSPLPQVRTAETHPGGYSIAETYSQLPQWIPDLLRQSSYGDHRDLRRTNPAAGARCAHLLRQYRKGGTV
jgi:hypothetical protein